LPSHSNPERCVCVIDRRCLSAAASVSWAGDAEARSSNIFP
jgi:hypothetical protein